jgi:hypothetical protein
MKPNEFNQDLVQSLKRSPRLLATFAVEFMVLPMRTQRKILRSVKGIKSTGLERVVARLRKQRLIRQRRIK